MSLKKIKEKQNECVLLLSRNKTKTIPLPNKELVNMDVMACWKNKVEMKKKCNSFC